MPLILSTFAKSLKRCKDHNIIIDYDGRIFSIVSESAYYGTWIHAAALNVIVAIFAIAKSFPYHAITVAGNTVYSRIVANTLTKPFVVCKSNNQLKAYITKEGDGILFEGPDYIEDDGIPNTMLPLNNEDISKLEQHTRLSFLKDIQNDIISLEQGVIVFDKVNKYVNPLMQSLHSSIVSSKEWAKLLWIVTATGECWLTDTLLIDYVIPVQAGEVLQTTCITATSEMKILPVYRMNKDLSISRLTNDETSLFYSLEVPRSFDKTDNIITLHPFHLPCNYDPTLTLMIVTKALFL